MEEHVNPNTESLEPFARLIEAEEKQKQDLAKHLHSKVLPELILIKINLIKRCKEVLKNKFNQEDLNKDFEPLNIVSDLLRTIMSDLYPSVLERYGLIKSLVAYSRSFSIKHGIIIDLNYEEETDKLPLTEGQQLHILRLFESIINYLFLELEHASLSIVIDVRENDILINFIKDRKGKIKKKSLTLSAKKEFKKVKARLLLANAQVSEKTDWVNTIQFIIPFSHIK